MPVQRVKKAERFYSPIRPGARKAKATSFKNRTPKVDCGKGGKLRKRMGKKRPAGPFVKHVFGVETKKLEIKAGEEGKIRNSARDLYPPKKKRRVAVQNSHHNTTKGRKRWVSQGGSSAF